MKKITVIKIADIGSQLDSMTTDQLTEFYRDKVQNPYIVDDFVSEIMADKPEKEFEEIPELVAVKMAEHSGVYLINSKKSQVKPITVFIHKGLMKDDAGNVRPIFNRVVSFNMISICYAGKSNCIESDFDPSLYKTILFKKEYNRLYREIELAARYKPKNISSLLVEKIESEKENLPAWSAVNGATNTFDLIRNVFNIVYDDNIFKYIIQNDYEKLEQEINSAKQHKDVFVKQEEEATKKLLRKTLYDKIVMTKFGNKKLDKKEIDYVNAEVARFYENDNFLITNKCAHIRLYHKLRMSESLDDKKHWLFKLKDFIGQSFERRRSRQQTRGGAENMGLISCSVCSRPLMCSHVIDLINAMSYTSTVEQIQKEMEKYINPDIITNNGTRYYCKYCGEHLYDNDTITTSSDIRGTTLAENSEYQDILWREIKHLLNSVRFNVDTSRKNKYGIYQIDPQKFIQQGITTLTPWLEVVKRKESRNKTLTNEEVTMLLDIHAAIYATVLITVLSIHDPLIELIKPKITSRKVDTISKTITDYIIEYKVTAFRHLAGKINATIINSKVSAAYAIMFNSYKGDYAITDNLTTLYESIINSDPIARQLQFSVTTNQLILSKDPNIYSYIVVPNYAKPENVINSLDHFSGSMIRMYAEAYKEEKWPPDFSVFDKAIFEINRRNRLEHAVIYERVKRDKERRPGENKENDKLHLDKFYDEKGNPYQWNIYVFNIAGKDVDIDPKKSDTLPADAVMIDMMTSDGLRYSEVSGDVDVISKALSKKYEIDQFYNRISVYCPMGGDHEFVDNVCSKCEFHSDWPVDSDEFGKYANKFMDKMLKENKNVLPELGIHSLIVDVPDESIDFKENPLIVKEFTTYANVDIKKLEIDQSSVRSRDDMRLISLVSLIQKMLTEWRDFKKAADKTFPIPITNGPNLIEMYRNMIGDKKVTKLADISPNVLNIATAGRITLPLDKIHQFLLELLAETFLPAEQMFVEEQMKQFIRMNERTIRDANWNKWESTTATIIKVMSTETAEERQTNKEMNEDEIDNENADEQEIEKAFETPYDLDNDFDNEDNMEKEIELD